jgi:hypothetical protein
MAFLACAPASLPIMPADARLPPEYTTIAMTVSISPPALTATTSHNGWCAVEFNGNVTIGNYPPDIFEGLAVHLDASCEWPWLISPNVLCCCSNGTYAFRLEVRVPPRTRAGPEKVTVFAQAVHDNRTVRGSAQCTVTADQYYRLDGTSIYGDGGVVQVPGSPATVEGVLHIRNVGNGNDTFIIEVIDPPDELRDYSLDEQVEAETGEWAEARYTLHIGFEMGLERRPPITVHFKITSLGALEDEGRPFQEEHATGWYQLTIYTPSASDEFVHGLPPNLGWGLGLAILGAIAAVQVWRHLRVRGRGTGGAKSHPWHRRQGA